MGIYLVPITIIVIFNSIPSIFILFSKRSEGGAKVGWFILALFCSYVALAIFLIFTHKPKRLEIEGSQYNS